jgi:hypothetical protein
MADLVTRTYFTTDGTYGSATEGEDIIIINTTDWTDEMWEQIESASDSERFFLAARLSKEAKRG